MSNIDKQALREVVEKATPGPWLWINTGSYFSFLVPQSNQDPHNCIIDDGSSWGEYGETINPESPDGVFIAAANPAAVLALLDELEAEQRISSTWRKTAESNREKLEAAEKRIAELEAKKVKIKLPESFYPDGDIDCPLVINEYQIIEAIVAAGCKPIAVCPRCKCELDLSHKPDGAHYCHPAAAGKGEAS
ncbi:Uncharacterised protein [Enterobacter hormaechei]|uniref:Ead/Ea22-like family protein n=1 Tax=Enterobacter hormaechei TaxID=158836 RepID=A0ABD7L392_9ENTR|nr:ead/Ea22-like family protein [Enterobacter hormaechei]EKK5515364.1 ead/Ea22-like family protein [Enterobacter hormaechei]SAF31872.1 Uncharacterised protein [Enterobacter hormaechei]HEM8105210.1 ead/Ea22-like family protein [Enterobacter hormaechei]HEM8123757.1 ead/Ea22-like family protein [Enterobacter hormaechei]